jgi:hypothetical protein
MNYPLSQALELIWNLQAFLISKFKFPTLWCICEAGKLRKVLNEELNDPYSSPTIVLVIKSRRMRLAGRVARMEEGRGMYMVMVGKPEGKRPLGRPRRR